MSPRRSNSVVALICACFLGNLAGCGSSSSAPTGDERAARGVLKVLGVEYENFLAQHDGQPPAEKAELVAFLETRKGRIAGLNDVEQLFVSPRDQQPLIIYYGESLPPADDTGFPLVAREATGVAGKCLVVSTRGGVKDVSVDELPSHLNAPN